MNNLAYRCLVAALVVFLVERALGVVQSGVLMTYFTSEVGFEIDLFFALTNSVFWFLLSVVAIVWVPGVARRYFLEAKQ